MCQRRSDGKEVDAVFSKSRNVSSWSADFCKNVFIILRQRFWANVTNKFLLSFTWSDFELSTFSEGSNTCGPIHDSVSSDFAVILALKSPSTVTGPIAFKFCDVVESNV